MQKTIIFYLFLLLALQSKAQNMNVTGNWNLALSTSQITEAGNDYDQNIESSASQSFLTHSLGGSIINQLFTNWQVYVQRIDTNWNPNLKIDVRRTGVGSYTIFASLNGGTVYQEINSSTSLFYIGSGNFSNIPVQYRLRGMSVTMPVGVHSTTLLYTLMDN